jgi:cyanophycinase
VILNATGIGTVIGKGPAYFVSNQPQSKLVCQRNTPLTFTQLQVWKYADYRSTGATFDFVNWKGVGGSMYTLSANAGVLNSSQPNGSIY